MYSNQHQQKLCLISVFITNCFRNSIWFRINLIKIIMRKLKIKFTRGIFKTVITKTIDESQTRQTSHRRLQTSHRRVTDESQTTTDQSQTSHRRLHTSHRRLQTSHRRIQMSHKLLQATRTTEVYFQPLTWFNRFICRPADICYCAIWSVYETSFSDALFSCVKFKSSWKKSCS